MVESDGPKLDPIFSQASPFKRIITIHDLNHCEKFATSLQMLDELERDAERSPGSYVANKSNCALSAVRNIHEFCIGGGRKHRQPDNLVTFLRMSSPEKHQPRGPKRRGTGQM